MVPCRNCKSDSWHIKHMIVFEGQSSERCSECAALSSMNVNDVFFDKPGVHHGIYNTMGQPIFVGSKQEKAYELKKRGLREAGDRVHGAQAFDPISHRHAMKSLERRSK